MAIDNTGAISLSDLKLFIEQLASKEKEEKTEETNTVEDKNTSIFEKAEIGGNGSNSVSTVQDVDSLLKKINNVITINSDISFADLEKTRNSLINKKANIQNEQDKTKDGIINKIADAIKFGKKVSTDVKSLIDELHDENLKNNLLTEYNIIKNQGSTDKYQMTRLDYIQ